MLAPNNFSFNGEHYQQISGVTMSAKMGPSYANLYVGLTVMLKNISLSKKQVTHPISLEASSMTVSVRHHVYGFAEHLRSVRKNDVDKPVDRHFNSAKHSILDMKVSAISSSSRGNDSRKRQERCLIFKLGTTHHYGLNERFSFIQSLISFC